MDDRTTLRVKTYQKYTVNTGIRWYVEIIGGTSGLRVGSLLSPDNGFFQYPDTVKDKGFTSRAAARTALHDYMAARITWLKVTGGLH